MKNLYKAILKKNKLWNYYNKELQTPNLTDSQSCYDFISKYIIYAEKSKTVLMNGLEDLKEKEPHRLKHIVSTFFIGIALYNKDLPIQSKIREELKTFKWLNEEDPVRIDQQFTYVWFMLCLYHDLAGKRFKVCRTLGIFNRSLAYNFIAVGQIHKIHFISVDFKKPA